MSRLYILHSLHLLIVQHMENNFFFFIFLEKQNIAFVTPSSKFLPVSPKATVSFVLLMYLEDLSREFALQVTNV